MKAYELLGKLRCLTLAGQNEDGELEWIGTMEQWNKVDGEMADILAKWDRIKCFNEIYGINLETEFNHKN